MKSRLLAALFLPLAALAQNAPDAAATNLIKNGSFDQFSTGENLRDGVDSQGYLRGRTSESDAVLEGGNIGKLALPLSVQVGDFNKDGLLDILTLDGTGYYHIYFNSGTPTEPKFTTCETIPVFLGRFRWPSPHGFRSYDEGNKVGVADFTKSGTLDLIVGNYFGDVMLIKNSGTQMAPEWKQPPTIESIRLATNRDNRRWGNLLAPAVYDWNKDGKMDLILGEGSYSANAVHLLLNTTTSFGAGAPPSFNDDAREYLAFGDGREQLVPAVVDYNGDGNPDLVVGDRTGSINVYLSQGPWKKGSELIRQPQPINFGGVTSIGTGSPTMRCVFPAVGDLNGDGKFDIVVGLPSGRIAVSYNIGTATEPKFGPLAELKGEETWKNTTFKAPNEWTVGFGFRQGNYYGYATVVTPEEDAEAAGAGAKVLKAGYFPPLNKIVKNQYLLLPGLSQEDKKCPDAWIGWAPDGLGAVAWGDGIGWGSLMCDSDVLFLRNSPAIKPATRYNLSFKVKGRNVRDGHATVFLAGWLVRDTAATKTSPNDPSNHAAEWQRVDLDFPVTGAWTTVTRPISFQFRKDADLNQFEKWKKPGSKIEYRSLLDIRGAVNQGDGVFYISDVQVTPQ